MTCTRKNCTCTGSLPVERPTEPPLWGVIVAIVVMLAIAATAMIAIWNLERTI